METHKEQFFNSLDIYNQNLDVLWSKEEEYKLLLIEQFESFLEKIKNEFLKYLRDKNYTVLSMEKFLHAVYGENFIALRLDFNEVFPTEKHQLNLAIMEVNKPRREYIITVQPNISDLYIPKRSVTISRPKPTNVVQAKEFIKSIEDEFVLLSERSAELRQMSFVLNCQDARSFTQSDGEMIIYSDFISIFKNLTAS